MKSYKKNRMEGKKWLKIIIECKKKIFQRDKVNYFKMKNRFHQEKIKIRKNRVINLKYLEQPLEYFKKQREEYLE